MLIQPVDIPTAAGVDYGGGDVRHFSEGDSISVPGMSNPTRQLAQRDNVLADKLNEVIGEVNNTERLIAVPLVRTTVPAVDEVVVANQRIAAGYESRIINAAISCSPASTDGELIVYYNAGFGGSTGTSVVNTSTEFTSGVQFYPEGEFIVVLRNKSAVSLDIAASVLVATRPLGGQGGLLVGSVVKGDKGDPGIQGPPGIPGPPGTGGAGSPGMVWLGTWSSGTAYNVNEVVAYTDSGVTSSYICVASHGATITPPPSNPTKWTLVAQGSVGPAGGTGPAGAGSVAFAAQSVSGTLTTGSDIVSSAIDGYSPAFSPSQTYLLPITETKITSTGTPSGSALLMGTYRALFIGSGTLTLPKSAYGAAVDYTNAFITVMATPNGTTPVDVSQIYQVTCYPKPATTDSFVFKVEGNSPRPVAFGIYGAQVIP